MTSFYGAVNATEATLEVRQLLEGLFPGEGDLLEALHRVQHRYGYVPKAALPAVAQHLRLPESRVYGALTFYSEFTTTPPPETVVSWCSGPACFIKGGEGIRLVLENMLRCGMGENTADNRLGLHLGQCNGTCDHAPQVWVNGKVRGPLSAATTVELVRELREGKSDGGGRGEEGHASGFSPR
jgi:NADH-quinone oxidoreductase subunit E